MGIATPRFRFQYAVKFILDVVAVYTAGKVGGGVDSIDVEAVRERVFR